MIAHWRNPAWPYLKSESHGDPELFRARQRARKIAAETKRPLAIVPVVWENLGKPKAVK